MGTFKLTQSHNYTQQTVLKGREVTDSNGGVQLDDPSHVKASVFCDVSARSRHFVTVDVIFSPFCVRQLLRFNILTWPRMSKFLSRIV